MAPRLVAQTTKLLERHVAELATCCGEPRVDFTLIGYVEFFDVSNASASQEHGPLLELEGAVWQAAALRRSPPWRRPATEPWVLCYFRRDRLSVGPENWERFDQPVRVYGDKFPMSETTYLGLARCRLMVRAAACFPRDAS